MKRLYKRSLIGFISIVLAFLNFSCEKKTNEEYTEEIFNSNFLSIYGDWELKKLSWGIIGGSKASFNFMTIYKIGRFKLWKDDEMLLCEGKIIITKQTDTSLSIYFDPEMFFEPGDKYVTLKGNDSLYLDGICHDCYHQYFFVREK